MAQCGLLKLSIDILETIVEYLTHDDYLALILLCKEMNQLSRELSRLRRKIEIFDLDDFKQLVPEIRVAVFINMGVRVSVPPHLPEIVIMINSIFHYESEVYPDVKCMYILNGSHYNWECFPNLEEIYVSDSAFNGGFDDMRVCKHLRRVVVTVNCMVAAERVTKPRAERLLASCPKLDLLVIPNLESKYNWSNPVLRSYFWRPISTGSGGNIRDDLSFQTRSCWEAESTQLVRIKKLISPLVYQRVFRE